MAHDPAEGPIHEEAPRETGRAAEAVGRTLGGHLHEPVRGDHVGEPGAQAGHGDAPQLQRGNGIVEVDEIDPALRHPCGNRRPKELRVELAGEHGPARLERVRGPHPRHLQPTDAIGGVRGPHAQQLDVAGLGQGLAQPRGRGGRAAHDPVRSQDERGQYLHAPRRFRREPARSGSSQVSRRAARRSNLGVHPKVARMREMSALRTAVSKARTRAGST